MGESAIRGAMDEALPLLIVGLVVVDLAEEAFEVEDLESEMSEVAIVISVSSGTAMISRGD
jgi:hypothetical protein